MKTIHIKNIQLLEGNRIYTNDVSKLKNLIKELFEFTLKDDPKFHFFFEPELIIRIDSESCLEKVNSYLNGKNIPFEEYDYPFPEPPGFGEERNGVVANNLDLFLSVFHANSVAAITLDEDSHKKYLERLIHTACNPKFYSHEVEGKIILELASLKFGSEQLAKILKIN